MDNGMVGLTVKEKKYLHARIIDHEFRVKRIEEFLNIPPIHKGVTRPRKRPHESTEISPSIRSKGIEQDGEPVTGRAVT